MPTLSRAFFERYILPNEGGYKPHHASDPETLFGLRLDTFTRALGNLTAAERTALPDDVERLLGDPSRLMRYIAARLEPNDNYGRTSERPRRGATAADIAAINAVKAIALDVFRERYCNELGIHQFPQNIANMATDMAIHRWRGAAMWTVVKAMAESGVIEYPCARYPAVTSAQAVNPKIFRDGGVGDAYFSPAMGDAIAADLRRATPEQLLLVEHNMAKWRRIYYQEQVRVERELGDPAANYHADALDGWNRRVASMESPQARAAYARFQARGGNTALASNSFALEVQMTAWDRGASAAYTTISNPTGEVAIETPYGLVRYEVNLRTLETGRLVEAPAGVRWIDGVGDATMAWNGQTLNVGPQLNAQIGQASNGRFGLPIMYDRDGNGLDGHSVARIERKANGSLVVRDADSDTLYPVAPVRTPNQVASEVPPRRPNGRS